MFCVGIPAAGSVVDGPLTKNKVNILPDLPVRCHPLEQFHSQLVLRESGVDCTAGVTRPTDTQHNASHLQR